VYGIVQQSGGSVLVYSEPGQGATFKVYLPRVDRVLDGPAVTASRRAGGVNNETILFVEDEPALRRMGHTILTREGYTVFTMSSADEALAHCEKYEGRIDLVATDMVMPGLNGRELVDRLHRSRPESKVLFMSGYTDDSIIQRGILQPGTAFLQKPFSAVGLARKIREVLDEESH
ncbi:MAG: response regulator, partial [Gemmatimonadales bacterium]